jgi:AhpD family alkylhydroperoxidase
VGSVLGGLTSGVTLAQIRYVTPVRPADAGEPLKRVYGQVMADFGMLAPPIALHSPSRDLTAAVWMMLRESLLAGDPAARGRKETVATSVSIGNSCPYCVEVHGAALLGLVDRADAGALAGDRTATVTDPGLRELAAWARTGGASGAVGADAPELAAVAVTFHYLNRMVNVFLPDSPLPSTMPRRMLRPAGWFAGKVFGSLARKRHLRGLSLDLLPAASVPRDLSWAIGPPAIAQAFARAWATVDELGERHVPASVRALVGRETTNWRGDPVDLGQRWLTEMTDQLPPIDRAAGRLALLVAFASHQVKPADVQALHDGPRGDLDLLGLTSWASMAAARRLGVLMMSGSAAGAAS